MEIYIIFYVLNPKIIEKLQVNLATPHGILIHSKIQFELRMSKIIRAELMKLNLVLWNNYHESEASWYLKPNPIAQNQIFKFF